MCILARSFSNEYIARLRMTSMRKSKNSCITSINPKTFGVKPTSAVTFTFTFTCNFVLLYNEFSTASASPLLFISTTTRTPSRSDSSRTSATPSICRLFTKSAICCTKVALFCIYGIDEMTISLSRLFSAAALSSFFAVFPLLFRLETFVLGTISATPLKVTPPLPSRYKFLSAFLLLVLLPLSFLSLLLLSLASLLSANITPPVGKSGPGMTLNNSSNFTCSPFCAALAKTTNASATSIKLCGGMLVAIPTAIPVLPLINTFGSFAGNTIGSCCDPSNVSANSTQSISTSFNSISCDNCLSLHSVYLIAAGGSLSMLPKFPCPFTNGADMEKSCAILTNASYTD